MATPNERDKEVTMNAIRAWDAVGPNEAGSVVAAYREEIEARAPEQGGEMREVLEAVAGIRRMAESIERGESWEGGYPDIGTCRILGDIKRISDKARALLARESSEPILEEHDRWIDTDAIPPEPAEERGPEVDALLWMTERLMGLSVALTMRGWLAEYRTTGQLVVRDTDGTVKESLTVAAEERGPEVGDIVAWDAEGLNVEAYKHPRPEIVRQPVVLMRRAEVEARIGGKA